MKKPILAINDNYSLLMDYSTYTFRKATLSDCQQLEELIVLSSQSINNKFYSTKIVNAAIGNIWIVDKQLIIDETYWLVETAEKEIVGCGGWSKRKLLFGNDQTTPSESGQLDPLVDPAKIRAFFVHPNHTRKGIGKELLTICENEAQLAGFKSLELVATLSGEKLYTTRGFQEEKRIEIDLGNNVYGEAVEMKKVL